MILLGGASSLRAIRSRAMAILLVVAIAAAPLLPADQAAADSGGSAQSHLVGRGDIVTSVLLELGGPRRPSGTSSPPRCAWTTLNDAQLEFLIAVIAPRRSEAAARLLLDALPAYLASDGTADATLQVQICDGTVLAFRTVAGTDPVDVQTLVGRRMITRLPVPDPVQSPPTGVSVPVHEPVFVSIADRDWQQIRTTLTVGDVTAEVRATPVSLRLFSGEPTSTLELCTGHGVPFDPQDPRSPSRQARRTGACTLDYRTASAAQGVAPTAELPAAWLGTVTVLWSAEWRTNGGPWRSLGLIPRTRLVERPTREVTTSIESSSRGR